MLKLAGLKSRKGFLLLLIVFLLPIAAKRISAVESENGGASEVMMAAEAESQSVPVAGYRIVNVYPHDPEAFTQGLVYEDGSLYESTGLWHH